MNSLNMFYAQLSASLESGCDARHCHRIAECARIVIGTNPKNIYRLLYRSLLDRALLQAKGDQA